MAEVAAGGVSADVLQSVLSEEENKHLAKSHNDTSEGAVHCFQDEYGERDAAVLFSSHSNNQATSACLFAYVYVFSVNLWTDAVSLVL